MDQELPPPPQQNGSVGLPPPPLQNGSVVGLPPPLPPTPPPPQHGCVGDWEHRLRRYLLLLASLAATVTYAAGLDPPGGSWVESDGEMMAVAGDSILRAINHRRYLAFYYSNATAFATSLVVILLLLVLPDKNRPLHTIYLGTGAWRRDLETTHLRVLRLVMVLDLLALMVAYTAGSCREKVATIYTAALVAALSAYVGIHILGADNDNDNGNGDPDPDPEIEKLRKVLMLLAIFTATIAYNAGLKPPGGFWEHTNGLHQPGEVVLKHKHGGRFAIFFFCNTAAFIAPLFTVVLLLDKKLTKSAKWRLTALYGFVVATLVALVAAYAAGSCRNTATTTYTVALVAVVLVSIFLAVVAVKTGMLGIDRWDEPGEQEKMSVVLLLGTLAASITYQAGLNPPGGVWLENQSGSHGHNAGDPILLKTDDKRYNIFFYCNSTALVASIVVILMVQIKALRKRRNALHLAMILDLFGLMAAYIAGSSQTLRASVHLIGMAAAFLVYVIVTYHVKFKEGNGVDPQHGPNYDAAAADAAAAARRRGLKKRRKALLLFAILMAAITYQAGLSPPGGFWREEQGGQGQSSVPVGSPILEDMYPRRYKAFFYCNAMSFMASIALITLLLQDDDETYKSAGIRFYGLLYSCMLVGMLVLMGAYAAGSARRLRTSIYVFALVGGVIGFTSLLFALFLHILGQGNNLNLDNNANANRGPRQGVHTKRKYVMLLAMLAASVTYQAGLDPPGGVWPEGYAAGSPVLHDSNVRRYHVFFYSNSSSFVASIVVITLLLQSAWLNKRQRYESEKMLLSATNIVVALDLVGLVVAYAAGSCRTLQTSLYVIVLVVAVVIYIVVITLSDAVSARSGANAGNAQANGRPLQGVLW